MVFVPIVIKPRTSKRKSSDFSNVSDPTWLDLNYSIVNPQNFEINPSRLFKRIPYDDVEDKNSLYNVDFVLCFQNCLYSVTSFHISYGPIDRVVQGERRLIQDYPNLQEIVRNQLKNASKFQ